MVAEAPSANSRGSGWLEGPYSDLLIGAGGAYLLSVPLFFLVVGDAVATDWSYTAIWIIAMLLNGPHYGATLMRIYAQREERRRYAVFSIWVTLALAAIFVVGLYQAFVGALILTVFFSWSPWHFAGQNYGVAVMFLHRSGVEISPLAKRLLYASFVLSSLLAIFVLHGEAAQGLHWPARGTVYTDPALLRLGIPRAIANGLFFVCGVAYLASVVGSIAILRRRATVRELLPVGSLILCQALWFAVPALLDVTGAWSTRSLVFAAIWLSAAHSSQYLWITFHYAKRSRSSLRLGEFLLKTMLAGNASIILPGILFAPMLLGSSLTWEEGLSSLVFAVINLHHFILDGAVWKLRDSKVASMLLRGGEEPPRPPAIDSRSSWRRPSTVLWVVFALLFVIEIAELARHQAQRLNSHRFAEATFDVLGWAGREHPIERVRFGRALLKEGDYESARVEFERSLQARPTVGAWGGMGRAFEGMREFSAAAEAYESGLALDPDDTALLRNAAAARSKAGEYERAIEFLNRALELEPDNPMNSQMLERAQRKLEP